MYKRTSASVAAGVRAAMKSWLHVKYIGVSRAVADDAEITARTYVHTLCNAPRHITTQFQNN